MRLKKNDNVQIISGKDKGKRGKITHVIPEKDQVVVEGLNLRIRHARGRREGEKGQRIEFSAPLRASNVMVIDPRTNRPTRLGTKTLADGKKIRISRATGEEI